MKRKATTNRIAAHLLTCRMKVRSADVDAYGVVNHAVYLNYYEQARLEYLEQRGLSFRQIWNEGRLFVIARAEVDYLQPLQESQEIEIPGRIADVGRTSVTFRQEIQRWPQRELISRGKFVAVFIDRETGSPVPAPESFIEAFRRKRN